MGLKVIGNLTACELGEAGIRWRRRLRRAIAETFESRSASFFEGISVGIVSVSAHIRRRWAWALDTRAEPAS
jgi:hypothetical protein